MHEKMKKRAKIQDVRFVEAECMECGKKYMVIYKFKVTSRKSHSL